MLFFVVQVNEVCLYFYKLKVEIMANTTTIECTKINFVVNIAPFVTHRDEKAHDTFGKLKKTRKIKNQIEKNVR